MLFLYLFALLPVTIGAGLWLKNKEINFLEFLIGSVCAFLVSGIIHICAIKGVTDDIQTLSGQIVKVRQFSEWREFYEQAIYRTEYYTTTESYSSNGKMKTRTVGRSRQVFSHWASRYRNHPEHWEAYSNIDSSYDINKAFFIELRDKFGGTVAVAGSRTTMEHNSRMVGGDRFDYVADNKTDYVQPVTKIAHWENKILGAGPSTFSFKKLTESEKQQVYEWPQNPNPWQSNRVINAPLNVAEWDKMNSRLGPIKKVNVIIVNFGEKSNEIVELQKARWMNGKKNDICLFYGEFNGAKWADCFGWSKSETVKSNLKTILLDNPINDSIIPLIENEISKNYELRQFEKDFAYLSIEPRGIHYFWLIFSMIMTQGGYYFFAHSNQFKKI